MPTLVEATKTTSQAIAENAEVAGTAMASYSADAFKDGVERTLARLNQLNAHSKQGLETMIAIAAATTKGAESLGSQVRAYNKLAFEKHVEAAKEIATASSAQEMLELQSAYAKSAFGEYIREMSQASEIVSCTISDAFRPLKERTTAVVESMWSAAD